MNSRHKGRPSASDDNQWGALFKSAGIHHCKRREIQMDRVPKDRSGVAAVSASPPVVDTATINKTEGRGFSEREGY
jgi:hypothetical protein